MLRESRMDGVGDPARRGERDIPTLELRKDNAAVKALFPKIIADWQDVPAMAYVAK